MWLDLLVSKSPLVPSNSTICPRKPQKSPQKPHWQRQPRSKNRPYLGLRVPQNTILRAHSPPAIPHFLWFPPIKLAQNGRVDPYTVAHWAAASSSPYTTEYTNPESAQAAAMYMTENGAPSYNIGTSPSANGGGVDGTQVVREPKVQFGEGTQGINESSSSQHRCSHQIVAAPPSTRSVGPPMI